MIQLKIDGVAWRVSGLEACVRRWARLKRKFITQGLIMLRSLDTDDLLFSGLISISLTMQSYAGISQRWALGSEI